MSSNTARRGFASRRLRCFPGKNRVETEHKKHYRTLGRGFSGRHHPEMAIVSESLVVIGIPQPGSKVVRTTFCSVPNIVEVEPFEIEKPSGGNGERRPKK